MIPTIEFYIQHEPRSFIERYPQRMRLDRANTVDLLNQILSVCETGPGPKWLVCYRGSKCGGRTRASRFIGYGSDAAHRVPRVGDYQSVRIGDSGNPAGRVIKYSVPGIRHLDRSAIILRKEGFCVGQDNRMIRRHSLIFFSVVC